MANSLQSNETTIVVDWGTSSIRVFLVSSSGKILANRESPRGIQFIKPGDFEDELLTCIGDWLDAHGPLTIVALGMITSRNGWVEVPYVTCPASIADLSKGTILHKLANDSSLLFLPGITDKTCKPYPDVMRGEETQIVGFGLQENATIVLPGTHSKWAKIAGGCIDSFQTFITGEIFALLSQYSFVAKVQKKAKTNVDTEIFYKGVHESRDGAAGKTPLLNLLFSARTGMLAAQLHPEEIQDYVSGLLIGYEFREAKQCGWFNTGDTVGIVGNDGLNALYKSAALEFGLSVSDGGENASIYGALKIFQHHHHKGSHQ